MARWQKVCSAATKGVTACLMWSMVLRKLAESVILLVLSLDKNAARQSLDFHLVRPLYGESGYLISELLTH